MLKGFFLSILLIAFTTVFAQQNLHQKIHKFPDYQTVVNHFYDSYWPNYEISITVMIEFARSQKGWHVVLKDFEDPKNTKQIVVWNQFGYHKPKNFIKRKESTDTTKHNYTNYQSREAQLTPYLIRMFNIHTFFGYKGWADDIVKHLAPKRTKLNDADLYSLGRAYSAISGGLMHHYENSTRQPLFDISKPRNNLNEEQLIQYLELQQNAQSCFKQLADRSPRFSTIVGKIQTKYANEVVQNYVDLWTVQNEELAQKQLIPNIYPPEILANARNYLRNCSIHAILLTSGDNDTYPLWYVQVMEGFRTDVTVVNISLLGLPKYVKAIQRGMNGVVVNLNLPQSVYDTTDLISFTPDGKNISGADFLNWVNEQPRAQQPFSPNSEVFFECPRKPNESIKGESCAHLFKSDLAILDMYYSNGRTIEFSNEEDKPAFFAGHFVLRGLVRSIDMCADYNVDHNAFFGFLESMEINDYLNPNNFPLKLDQSEPIDKIVVQNIYRNTLIALSDAIEQKDEERIQYYKINFTNMTEHWAVKPDAYLIELFKNIIEE